MKKQINKTNFFKIISYSYLITTLISCQSHEQKPDETFDQVKEEKMSFKNSNDVHLTKTESHDSSVAKKEIAEIPKKTELIKKNETKDEWSSFQTETDKKILANDNTIKSIKNMPDANNKLLRKLTRLEKENNDLRKQLDEYNETVKTMRENFKAKINHDVNEIGIELKDLSLNNKK